MPASLEMVMEDVFIAVDTGRCPACNGQLEFSESDLTVDFSCPGCGWQMGFSK